MIRLHVEKEKYPRGDLRFPTWIFEKGEIVEKAHELT